MRTKYFRYVLLTAIYLALGFTSPAYAADSIKWYSYEEGKILGRAENKKVFLHFYADWCGFCVKMAQETFRNSDVVSYLNENFISIRVNFDQEPVIAEKYGVMGLPSTFFLTQTGQPIANIPGYIPPDTLLSMLREVDGIDVAN